MPPYGGRGVEVVALYELVPYLSCWPRPAVDDKQRIARGVQLHSGSQNQTVLVVGMLAARLRPGAVKKRSSSGRCPSTSSTTRRSVRHFQSTGRL